MANYKPLGTQFDRKFRNDLNENFTSLDVVAEQAKAKSDTIQAQVDQLVVSGDSSVEAAQARVASDGTSFGTLKARLDDRDAQLADNAKKIDKWKTVDLPTTSNQWYRLLNLGTNIYKASAQFSLKCEFFINDLFQHLDIEGKLPFDDQRIELIVNNTKGQLSQWNIFNSVRIVSVPNGANFDYFLDIRAQMTGTIGCKFSLNSLSYYESVDAKIIDSIVASTTGTQLIKHDILFQIPKTKNMVVKLLDDRLQVHWKYNLQNDYQVVIEKAGTNNIMQLSQMDLLPSNSNPSMLVDFDRTTSLNLVPGRTTDLIAPIKLEAKTNINGTSVTPAFTGGYHGYQDNPSGTPTARTVTYTAIANGTEIVNGFVGFCDKVEVIVVNRIQAWNTMKTDGTGREVLEEIVRYEIYDGDIKVHVQHRALEDVKITQYYAMQLYFASAGYAGYLSFFDAKDVNGLNTIVKDLSVADPSYNAGLYCSIMELFKDSNTIYMEIDSGYGLGKREYADNSHQSAFTTSSDKAYFNLIAPTPALDLNSQQKVFWRGKYSPRYLKRL